MPIIPPLMPVDSPISDADVGTHMAYDPIFQPYGLGTLRLNNRIVVSPMGSVRRLGSPESIAWYRRLVRGKPGLLIVEATPVEWLTSGEISSKELNELTNSMHQDGIPVVLQLSKVGLLHRAASDLSRQDIQDFFLGYAAASEICLRADFDAIEIHGGHGYCVNQFLSRVRNTRVDEYGGSLRNRMRFGVELVERVANATKGRMTILYRHTPESFDGYTTMPYTQVEYTLQDSLEFTQELAKVGLHGIDLSPGRREYPGDLGTRFVAEVGIAVIAVGGFNDPVQACNALVEERCHLIAIGRGLLVDPDWPEKVRTGRVAEIVQCIACNECMNLLLRGMPVRCERNRVLRAMAQHIADDYDVKQLSIPPFKE